MSDDVLSVDISGEYLLNQAFAALQRDVAGVPAAVQKVEESGNKTAIAIEKVKKALDGMGPAGEAISSVIGKVDKIGSAVGTIAKIGAVGGTVALVAKQLYDYAEGTQKAASEMVQLASAHNLTTDQVQALQDLAKRSGKTFEELAETVGKNKLALDTITQTFVATGQAIDTNITAKVAEMERKSKESTERMEVHFNRVRAFVAELYVPAKSSVLDFAAASMDNVARAVNALDLGKLRNIMGALLNPGMAGAAIAQAVTGGDAVSKSAEEAKRAGEELARLRQNLATAEVRDPQGRRAQSLREEIAKQEQVEREAQQRHQAAIRGTWGGKMYTGPLGGGIGSPDGVVDPVTGAPKPTATGGGGGGGRTDDDMLEAQIKRYEALGSAATRAIGSINTERSKSLEDMQREVNVQRQIDEIVGKLGAKYTEASQAQKDRLYAAVSGAEMERAAGEKLMQSHVRADATQRQFGNGMLQFVQTQQQLKEAFDTGRLSTDAYANAIKALDQNTEDLRLKNIGLQGGLPALAAGWQNAANQSERANNMFATGGKLYEQVMSTMTTATKSWGQSFDQILASAGISWGNFLANMALQAGTSSLFKMLGGTSGYNPGEAETLSIVGSGGGGVLSGIGSWLGNLFGFADGGRPPVGVPSWVGERGRELFVPDAAGTVYNQDQLGRMRGAGGGIVFNQYLDLKVGEFVTPTQLAQVERRAKDGAIAGIMQLQSSGDGRMRDAGF